jgi:hypothetical protein
MPGARCTRGLVCKIVRRNAHEHTGSAETLRHSPRNGFTAYAVLSPATNSSCHRRQRIDGSSEPGRTRHASADLAPATGVRTTRFCRTQPPVFAKRLRRARRRSSCAPLFAHGNRPANNLRADAAASTASHPAFVTIAILPSCRERTGRAGSADLPDGGSEIFFPKGLDDPNHLEIAAQIKIYAQRIFRSFVIERRGLQTDLPRRANQLYAGTPSLPPPTRICIIESREATAARQCDCRRGGAADKARG